MDYIAHIRQSDDEIQTVPQHLTEVRELAEQHGQKIGMKHLAGLSGWLHDAGKYTSIFRDYIEKVVQDRDDAPKRGSVDHATAGGRFLYRRYHLPSSSSLHKITAEWIANSIISHHGALHDYLSPDFKFPFRRRVIEKELAEYSEAEQELLKQVPLDELDAYFEQAAEEVKQLTGIMNQNGLSKMTFALIIKSMFSCLIDADRTSTRIFEEGGVAEPARDHKAFFQRAYEALLHHLSGLEEDASAEEPINKLRRQMSQQCDDFALKHSGIYTLSIPTGGGKTLASLRYGLRHALEYNKDRIIYIVPYTTIIEQNAKDVRDIIGEEDMILEHHSNVVDEEPPSSTASERDEDEEQAYDLRKKKLKLARDNWDKPIIFTTMVQFLNTFFSKGTRNVRRLHQLCNAVIIFDEVQSVPINCIAMFNSTLNFLNILGKSSLLLCTATQPALDEVKHKLKLSKESEVIGNLKEVGMAFKRVEIVDRTTSTGWKSGELADFVAERLEEVNSVLVILNTKSAVRKLNDELKARKDLLPEGMILVHLSTNMCAAHRKDELEKLKKALKGEQKVVCVSTQLIEAGVNISFQCIIRSLAGLDSIAQAAGRCNRHSEGPVRNVYVIRSADENLQHLSEIKCGAEQTERLLFEYRANPALFGNDLLSSAAIRQYFVYYYAKMQDQMKYRIKPLQQDMFQLLGTNSHYRGAYSNKTGQLPDQCNYSAMATAERYFEAISNRAMAVLVPYNADADKLIADLNGELDITRLGELLQKSQQYVVNIYDHDKRKLEKSGDMYPLLHGQVWALRPTAYSATFGVDAEGEGMWHGGII